MLRSIINFFRAVVQWIWRRISQPWIRNTLIGIAIVVALTVLILSGYSFFTVYSGIIGFLIIFGVLSFWIEPLRGILVAILVAGALFYFGDEIIFDKVVPAVDNYISKNYSNFPKWKETRKELVNNRLGENIISAKKEIMGSEVVKGTFGILIEDSVAYDEYGSVISDIQLKKEQRVMSLGLKSMAQDESPNGVGTEGMALVAIANKYGDFVQSRTAYIPIRKIEWESSKKNSKEKSSEKGWEKVEERVVDFSRVKIVSVTPDSHIAQISLPLKMEAGNYKIKIRGEYQFFLGKEWKEFPWQGNDRLVSFPTRKEFSELENGAIIVLKGAENITPISEDGAKISLSGKIDKLTLRVNTFFKYKNEYLLPNGGFIVRNSDKKPLTIIIEKEVKK